MSAQESTQTTPTCTCSVCRTDRSPACRTDTLSTEISSSESDYVSHLRRVLHRTARNGAVISVLTVRHLVFLHGMNVRASVSTLAFMSQPVATDNTFHVIWSLSLKRAKPATTAVFCFWLSTSTPVSNVKSKSSMDENGLWQRRMGKKSSGNWKHMEY